MIDISPPESELWCRFEERRRALGVPEVRRICGNILTIDKTFPGLQFDVVHCSGVLYHMLSPILLLAALRQLTREYLVLTSVVTSTRVTNDHGTLEVPQGAMLFVPALEQRERAILRSHWERVTTAIGLTTDTEWHADNFAPWWWLPTIKSLEAACNATGFECEAGAYCWNDNAYSLLLSVPK
jgi:hypothetical protein